MKRARRWLPLLKLAVGVGLMTWLYARADLGEFRRVFRSPALWLVVPIYGILFLNTVISALKWRLLLRADGIDIRWGTLVRSYLVATFFNLFLPSSIGGDAYRVYDVARRSSRAAEGFASVFADRLTGFFAVTLWGLLFALVGLSRLPNRRILLVPAAVFAAIALLVALLLQRRLLRWGLRVLRLDRVPGLGGFVEKFLGSIALYRRNAPLLRRALGISLVFQFLAIYGIYLISRLLTLDIPLLYFCVFIPLITLVEALPISIFGLGIRDASYVFFFSQVGVTREAALSLALLYLAVTVVYAAAGGIVFLLRGAPGRAPADPPA